MGTDAPTLSGLNDIYTNVVQVVLILGGIVLFILLLSGGFKFITSGGDPKAVEGAKKTLTYAVGGLVLLAGSYLLLKLISDVTGVQSILNFSITH